ncbi:hypothetical protein GGI42DRAFT_255958 [Trichoderma sp. SZMC 28013]
MEALCSFSALASSCLKTFSSGRVGRVEGAESAAGAAAAAGAAIVLIRADGQNRLSEENEEARRSRHDFPVESGMGTGRKGREKGESDDELVRRSKRRKKKPKSTLSNNLVVKKNCPGRTTFFDNGQGPTPKKKINIKFKGSTVESNEFLLWATQLDFYRYILAIGMLQRPLKATAVEDTVVPSQGEF